ncbi:unnamed protein product [marine sediment metagenome]|uniref:Uncharacterized protein n=1 Tax=marine sediment metagenome TaxID=412755 RepID=X0UHF8_9ZZZZ
MKTERLDWEVYIANNLGSSNTKIVFETATDIYSMTIYRKNWFGKWKKKVYLWGFSRSAKKMLEGLNNWLEVYKETG